jgi:hypothetical protein
MSFHTFPRLIARDSWRDIQKFEEPRPTVGKHEALFNVRSVALNYRDIAISTSKYPFPVKDSVIRRPILLVILLKLAKELLGLPQETESWLPLILPLCMDRSRTGTLLWVAQSTEL